MIHITNKKEKKKQSKHNLHSAGYHIREQTEPQELETSNLLCRGVMLHNANTTATTETSQVSHYPRPKTALTLITSLPLGATTAMWNSQGQRCCKSLWQPASSCRPAGFSALQQGVEEEKGGQEAPAELPELCFLRRGAMGLAEDKKLGWGFTS